VEIVRGEIPLKHGKDGGKNQNKPMVQAMSGRRNPYDFSFFAHHSPAPPVIL
jgi:hypothetical protein